MLDDGDALLNAIGVGLVAFLVVAVGLVALGFATSTPADDAAPDADFDLRQANDSHVRVVHAGGDPVPTDELLVTVEGYRRPMGWAGTLAEGEGGVVAASSGAQVRVYWTGDRGKLRPLGSWRLGPDGPVDATTTTTGDGTDAGAVAGPRDGDRLPAGGG